MTLQTLNCIRFFVFIFELQSFAKGSSGLFNYSDFKPVVVDGDSAYYILPLRLGKFLRHYAKSVPENCQTFEIRLPDGAAGLSRIFLSKIHRFCQQN